MKKALHHFTLKLLLIIMGSSILLTACNNPTSKPTIEPDHTSVPLIQETQTSDMFASPISPIVTPVPTSESANTIIPTPVPGRGVVYGSVGSVNDNQRIWAISGKIYLTPLIYAKDQNGEPVVPILGLDIGKDQNEKLEANATFIFNNVPPGEYGMVLNNPIENYPVPGDHPSGFLIVSVEDGGIVDVGEIPLP